MRPCLEVGCPYTVRSGRCVKHAAAHRAARAARKQASAPRRVYEDPRWRAARKRAIDRAGGRCQALEQRERCPVTWGLHGHHAYEGGVEQMLVDGADPFDERWIVVLCASHHGQMEAWLRARTRRNDRIRR